MHDLHMIHTDLKPENILLVSSEYLKIPDYKVLLLCMNLFYFLIGLVILDIIILGEACSMLMFRENFYFCLMHKTYRLNVS